MPLIAPEVTGPVSPCNKKIRIKGHIAGATVKILVNGNETFSKVSNWPDDVFDVGTALAQGDKIAAVQEFGNETSPASPLPAVVQALPTVLASQTILTNLYACGTALWSEGAVPGAEVRALIGSTEVGKGGSIDGIARLKYKPGLNPNQTLTLEQTTCNNLSKTTVSAPATPLPSTLPVPQIEEPLIECLTAIKISGILDGATVTIYRDGAKDVSGAFDRSSLTWIGLKPLKVGELVEVDQSFTCRKRGEPDEEPTEPTLISGKASAKVQSADELKAPKILSPICPNPTLITITNLLPSARVILYENGNVIGMTDTPESSYSFPAPPLGPNAKLTARMQLCDKDGPLSKEVEVKKDEPLNYLNVSKLYECASYIFIRNDLYLDQGKIVYAKNKQGDIISAYHQVFTSRFLFPVSPSLVAGDEITIVVIGCDGKEQEWGPHKVEKLKRIGPPELHDPIVEGSTSVEVISMVAGAHIKVFVDGVYKGQAISRGDWSYTPVSLPIQLQLGQEVTATHSLCGMISPPSPPETVVIPPPLVPELIQPSHNQNNVTPNPATFKWKDPGANSSAAATDLYLSVYHGNSLIYNYAGGTNTQKDKNLSFDTSYTWKVDAANSTGSTSSSTNSFKTGSAPEPEPEEPPENALLAFGSSLYASLDTINILYPVPANQAFKICIVVANFGNAPSDPFQVVFALWKGSTFLGTDSVSFGAAAPGWSDIAHAPVDPLPAGQDYLFEVGLIVNGNQVAYTTYGAWVGF